MDVNIDISNAKIETDRLLLRAWQETDLDDFFEYASVEGVGEMAGLCEIAARIYKTLSSDIVWDVAINEIPEIYEFLKQKHKNIV